MKKLLSLSFLLLLVSCDKPKNEEFAHNVKCANNEIVYKTKYNYPIEIESEDWDDAFGCSLVKNTYSDGYGKLVFDDDIVAIPTSAFENFSTLTHVKLPNCVKTINKSAFMGCTALKSIVIPNSVTSIGSSVFAKCTNLTDVNIPKGVTTIYAHTFLGCSSLTSLSIPTSITSILADAFAGCTGMEKVVIADMRAWCMIDFATSKSNPLSINAKLYVKSKEVTNLVIPSNIEYIKNYTFDGCGSLESVTIHNHVISIGKSSFRFCDNLINIYCKASIPPTLGDTSVFDYNGGNRIIHVPSSNNNAIINAYKAEWAKYATYIEEYDYEKE